MGYENENFEPMIVDIETAARDGIDDLIEVPSAPANYKDPAKILDAKLEKLKTLIDRAALDIYLNRIVCIGVWTPSCGIQVVTSPDAPAERLAIAALGLMIANGGYRRPVITFNGLSFDLPNLMVRASLHAMEFPSLDITPSWRSPHIDLMDVMTFGGKFAKHSLDFYCKVYGIDSDAPDEVKAITGADIPKLAIDGQWDLIAGHCRHDLIRTVRLAQRRKVIADVALSTDHARREVGLDPPF